VARRAPDHLEAELARAPAALTRALEHDLDGRVVLLVIALVVHHTLAAQ
jgi:hypothetical protein